MPKTANTAAAKAVVTTSVALPTPAEPSLAKVLPRTAGPTKLDQLVALLSRPEGATIADMQAATGWQAHSVRGALAGALKARLSVSISSKKQDGVRVYWISPEVES